jgi:serine phosphatase RsbU (regulator of sigma subunit)
MPLHTIHGTGAKSSLLPPPAPARVATPNRSPAIQVGMFPQGSVRTVDTTTCHEFQPFYEMGGDFLDFFTLTDGVIEIYLDHVTGKGLPAAQYATLAVRTLRGGHKTGTPPATVLSTVNRRVMLRGVSSPRYVTVQYACFDPRIGILRIASAGMEGLLIPSSRGCRELELRGIPPGMFRETNYERDGATGARRFGNFLERWIRRITKLRRRVLWHGKSARGVRIVAADTPEEILRQMAEAVARFTRGRPQQDDRTAAILRYLPSA